MRYNPDINQILTVNLKALKHNKRQLWGETNKVLKSSSAVNPYKLNKQDYSIREIEVDAVVKMANSLLK